MFTRQMQKAAGRVLDEVKLRMPNAGQFLAWFRLPEKQLNEWGTARIFKSSTRFKSNCSQTDN